MKVLKQALLDVLIWCAQGILIGVAIMSPLGVLIISDHYRHLGVGLTVVIVEFLLFFTYLRYIDLKAIGE